MPNTLSTSGAEILRKWIKELKRQQGKKISDIQDELGNTIGFTSDMIYHWRKGNPPSTLGPAIALVKEIVRQLKSVDKDEFYNFLRWAGHTHPEVVWNEIFAIQPFYGPAPVEHFTGRDKELKELIEGLQPGKIVSICGAGGIGKSALIAEVIKQLSPQDNPSTRSFDSIFFHDFYKQPSSDAALEQIYRIYGRDEKPFPTPRDAAYRALANKRVLLVLDGAEEADDLDRVLGVRDRNKGGALIVTRDKREVQGKVIFLDVPPLAEALIILRAWSTAEPNQTEIQVWSDSPEVDHVVGREICELLGRLPLALRLAGRYMSRKMTAPTYLAVLKETPLAGLHERDRQHRSVPILLRKTLEEGVSDGARQALSVFGLLSFQSVDIDTLAVALNVSSGTTVRTLLTELVQLSIAKLSQENSYVLIHRLIYSYAKENLEHHNVTIIRLASHFTGLAKKQTTLDLYHYRRALEILSLHIHSILEWSLDRKIWGSVHLLARTIVEDADPIGMWVDHFTICEIGFKASSEMGDKKAGGYWLGSLGNLYHHKRNELQEAANHFQRAFEIAREAEDYLLWGLATGCIGLILEDAGQPSTANEWYGVAYAASIEAKNVILEGFIRGKWGNNLHTIGSLDLAEKQLRVALTIAKTIKNQELEQDVLSNLGLLCRTLNRDDEAIQCYIDALKLTRKTHNRLLEGVLIASLLKIHDRLEREDEAFEYAEQLSHVIPHLPPDDYAFISFAPFKYHEYWLRDYACWRKLWRLGSIYLS